MTNWKRQIRTPKVAFQVKVFPEVRQAFLTWSERNGFSTASEAFVYIVKNIENETAFFADVNSYAKWKQDQLNQVDRTARAAARQEVNLVLMEKGFDTSGYQR